MDTNNYASGVGIQREYFDEKWSKRIAADRSRDTLKICARWVTGNLRGNARILDIGCGDGSITHEVATSPKVSKLVAIDISTKGIEYAQRHYAHHKINYRNISIEEFPLNEKFDLVYMFVLIEHVKNPLSLLEKCAKLLVKGGILFFTTPNKLRLENRIRRFLGKREVLADRTHIREYTIDEMKEMLQKTGFHSVRVKGLGLWGGWIFYFTSLARTFTFLWSNRINGWSGRLFPTLANTLHVTSKKFG